MKKKSEKTKIVQKQKNIGIIGAQRDLNRSDSVSSGCYRPGTTTRIAAGQRDVSVVCQCQACYVAKTKSKQTDNINIDGEQ